MSFFTTLNKFDAEGTPIKYDNYDTEAEAQARIIELHNMGLTDAFYIDGEATAVNGHRCFVSCQHWTADLIAKTVTLDQVSLEADIRKKHMKKVRAERNDFLVDSDNYINPDQWASMDAEAQNKWSVYRQQLRDFPATVDDPADPTWPTKPT
jgi:hypothetical protein